MTEGAEPLIFQSQKIDFSADLAAMKTIGEALNPLDEQARKRVMTYILNVFQIKASGKPAPSHEAASDGDAEDQVGAEAGIAPKYDSFADLFEAT